VLALVVGYESLQRPGQDRIIGFALGARALAELLVRAHPAADLGQRAGLAVEVGGFKELAVLDQPHGRRDVVVGGTGLHAWGRIRALHTASGFQHGLFYGEGDGDVIKIANALNGWPGSNFEGWYFCARFPVDG
jgi:hypothetical protein